MDRIDRSSTSDPEIWAVRSLKCLDLDLPSDASISRPGIAWQGLDGPGDIRSYYCIPYLSVQLYSHTSLSFSYFSVAIIVGVAIGNEWPAIEDWMWDHRRVRIWLKRLCFVTYGYYDILNNWAVGQGLEYGKVRRKKTTIPEDTVSATWSRLQRNDGKTHVTNNTIRSSQFNKHT